MMSDNKKLYKILVRVDMDMIYDVAKDNLMGAEDEKPAEDDLHEVLEEQVGDLFYDGDDTFEFLDLQECHEDDTVKYPGHDPYFRKRNMK
jgi:hypothetical protein